MPEPKPRGVFFCQRDVAELPQRGVAHLLSRQASLDVVLRLLLDVVLHVRSAS
jgi:hypothetical protein